MIRQINLHKVENPLLNMAFYSKCSICSVLHAQNNSVFCDFCTKYFFYIKEGDALLFNIKNLWIEVATKKTELNFSYYEFQNLEKELVQISEKNLAFSYNPQNLSWYIDFAYDSNNHDNLKAINTVIDEILTRFFENSYFNLDILNIEKNNIIQKLEYFDKHRVLDDNTRIYTPEFATILKLPKVKKSTLNYMSREVIVKNFYEYLPFFEPVD